MAKALICDSKLLQKKLNDKIYLITGANSGIGLITAEQLAIQGATVVLACRRVDAGEDAKRKMLENGSNADQVDVMRLDLANLNSVRTFCNEFQKKYQRLDGLINNAGVMNTPNQKTDDNFELQFGVNHLGHFLLTSLLTDLLIRSAPSRILCLSSCFHDAAMGRRGHIDFEDPNFETRKYDGWQAYAQSKLANLLHAKELARRLQSQKVTAVSLHPGWVRTDLIKHSMPTWLQNTVLKPILSMMGMIEPWEGAQTGFHCLLDDSIPDYNGQYFSQTGTYTDKKCNKGGWPLKSPNPEAHDDAVAKKLWELSENLVGLS